MFDPSSWFLNPWSMAAGLLLVSVPIIIHLINRIRYKRIRWAAMEFLLKAQKRVKRKLILQQLLLLLMRCMMVFLVGLLVGRLLELGAVGRFLGLTTADNRPTVHVAVLDDSPSMADGWKADDGTQTDAFELGKRVIADQIAKAAAEATTAQTMQVARLSDLGNARDYGRLNNQSIAKIKDELTAAKPSTVRVPLADALRAVKGKLDAQAGDVGKVVHVVSDFRAGDWAEEGDAVKQAVSELTAAGVKVYLVDAVHPFRKKDDRRSPPAHDNVSVVAFHPNKLVAARYDPVEFTLTVRNNGAAELKDVRFSIRVNGDENAGGRSIIIPTLPGNQDRTVKFEVSFNRVGSAEKPFERFSLVSAVLASTEPGGLAADNVRHAVVEVRDRLPILVVEGRPAVRDQKDGDGFYLRPVFNTVLGGFSWIDGTLRDLEQQDLTKYTFVLLLNVPALPDAAVKNLERYAAGGGGVGFFLGPDVKAKEYNAAMYRDGAGLFPLPLADQPSPELSADELQLRRFRISQKKLLLRDPAKRTHPALVGLYTDERGQPVKDAEQLEKVFGFITIKQYWPAVRVGKWRTERSVSELYCMPNEQPMSDFGDVARGLANGLPVDDPAFAKFKEALTRVRGDLRRVADSGDPLYKLAWELDALLADQISGEDKEAALLREFWANPKNADLRTTAVRLRDAVKFGDPFYVAKDFGRGRVSVVTTTAGETWTDWPAEKPGSASYTPIMKELGNYLSGAGADENHVTGGPLTAAFDAGRYRAAAKWAFVTHDAAAHAPGAAPGPADAPISAPADVNLTASADALTLRFDQTRDAGAYLFGVTRLNSGAGAAKEDETPEYLGFAANLDAAREGDLRRVSRDDVTHYAPGAAFNSAGDESWLTDLKQKRTDLSELALLFLLLMVLLIAEQALAVALSFHASPSELEAAAPSAAAAMTGHTAPHEPTPAEPTAASVSG